MVFSLKKLIKDPWSALESRSTTIIFPVGLVLASQGDCWTPPGVGIPKSKELKDSYIEHSQSIMIAPWSNQKRIRPFLSTQTSAGSAGYSSVHPFKAQLAVPGVLGT